MNEPSPEPASLLAAAYSLPFGMAAPCGDTWQYLVAKTKKAYDSVLAGPLRIRGFTARLGAPETCFDLPKGFFEDQRSRRPPFPLNIYSWLDEAAHPADEGILELNEDHLDQSSFLVLERDLSHSLYWHGDFDPDFYAAQAKAGCIAVSIDRGDRVFLAPELQAAYAVLDWDNLRRSKSLSRFMRSGKLAAMKPRLVCSPDTDPVLGALAERWAAHTWLTPQYVDIVREITKKPRGGMRFWGVELRLGDEGTLAAGELGYTFGSVYTSLSGFRRMEKPFGNLGKVQLQLLAEHLMSRGFAFWNLGHPHMQYKLELGASILGRGDFLNRWRPAASSPELGL